MTKRIEATLKLDTLDGGYIATVNDIPGCTSQGETVAETMHNLTDALQGITRDQLAPYLRGIADPKGTGQLPPREAEVIEQVEANLARKQYTSD